MRKYLIICFLLVSCEENEEASTYRVCDGWGNASCPRGTNVPFCTNGFKWGNDNPYDQAGQNVQGPGTGGGVVTYSFRGEGEVFGMHAQDGIISLAFDNLNSCAKEKVREAFQKWEAVAGISFEEVSDSELSDIVLSAGQIEDPEIGAVGYPSYTGVPCEDLAGQIIFDIPTRSNCDRFLNLALHEIGHALGLGHVGSNNIMNPNWNDNETDLQGGDILGIQSIYGVK